MTVAGQAFAAAVADFISFVDMARCLRRVHSDHFDLVLLWKIRRLYLSWWCCPRDRWPAAHRHLPSLAGQL